MAREFSLFIGTFTTLLAVINPFVVIPVYLKLLEGKDVKGHREVARRACLYALILCPFFLVSGTLILRLFGVPLSMVRIAGGIILMKIGFELFSLSKSGGGMIPTDAEDDANIAFVPLAIPLMCGPGAIATILGMTSEIKQPSANLAALAAIVAAIIATTLVTYLCLRACFQRNSVRGGMMPSPGLLASSSRQWVSVWSSMASSRHCKPMALHFDAKQFWRGKMLAS